MHKCMHVSCVHIKHNIKYREEDANEMEKYFFFASFYTCRIFIGESNEHVRVSSGLYYMSIHVSTIYIYSSILCLIRCI